MAQSAPFNPATDPALGVGEYRDVLSSFPTHTSLDVHDDLIRFMLALIHSISTGYVSVFIVMYNVIFFGGTYRICAWDFREPFDPDAKITPEAFKARWARRNRWIHQRIRRLRGLDEKRPGGEIELGKEVELAEIAAGPEDKADERDKDTKEEAEMAVDVLLTRPESSHPQPSEISVLVPINQLERQVSAASVEAVLPETHPPSSSFASLNHLDNSTSSHPQRQHSQGSKRDSIVPVPSSPVASHRSPPPTPTVAFFRGILHTFSLLVSPVTVTLVVALVVALVNPLKALFVADIDGWSGTRIKLAPDGRPALAFIYDVSRFYLSDLHTREVKFANLLSTYNRHPAVHTDDTLPHTMSHAKKTTTFLGAITVPGALILLGASFARLSIPRPFSKLPISTLR